MDDIIRQFKGREARPAVQFIKYVISGGLVTLSGMLVFGVLAWKVFPALQEDEFITRFLGLRVPVLTEAARARNFAYCKVIEFILSNLLCYFINSAWVFKPGRHSRSKELALFYLFALLSFVAGTGLGAGLIIFASASALLAYSLNMLTSVMINYLGHKYIVFQG